MKFGAPSPGRVNSGGPLPDPVNPGDPAPGRVVAQLHWRGVAARMRAAVAGREVERLGRRHLADGLPQMAVFVFDHVGRSIAIWGRYEREELALLMQAIGPVLQPGGVCIDIGANVGNHALFFADHFAEVLAFEPNPRTFALLQLNATLRPNVRCFGFGLSDAEGHAMLSVPAGNAGMASLHPAGGEAAQVACRLRRLDDVAEVAACRVALVKLDVEGHEAAALRGATAMLRRDRPVVVFEQAAADIASGTSATLELLRGLGYCRLWTLEPLPAGGNRWLTLARRFVGGEGLRLVESQALEPRFHSMVVALPGSR